MCQLHVMVIEPLVGVAAIPLATCQGSYEHLSMHVPPILNNKRMAATEVWLIKMEAKTRSASSLQAAMWGLSKLSLTCGGSEWFQPCKLPQRITIIEWHMGKLRAIGKGLSGWVTTTGTT